jgi:hypothetical protein
MLPEVLVQAAAWSLVLLAALGWLLCLSHALAWFAARLLRHFGVWRDYVAFEMSRRVEPQEDDDE